MKYGVKKRKLSRKKAHRNHLVRNLATQLFLHGRIKTTLAKAKTVQPVVDKLVTLSRQKNKLVVRRYLQSFLYSQKAAENVLDYSRGDLKDKASGFAKIIRIDSRLGDGSKLALLDLSIDNKKKSFFLAAEIKKKKDKKEGKEGKESEPEKEPSQKKGGTLKKGGTFWDRFKAQKGSKTESKKDRQGGDIDKKDPTQRTTSK
jgi:large subunit ribosomal protein L17